MFIYVLLSLSLIFYRCIISVLYISVCVVELMCYKEYITYINWLYICRFIIKQTGPPPRTLDRTGARSSHMITQHRRQNNRGKLKYYKLKLSLSLSLSLSHSLSLSLSLYLPGVLYLANIIFDLR